MADYGTDVDGTPDLDPRFVTVSGFSALGQALARRLETPRGGLFYDPDYGTDVRGRLNDTFTATGMHALQSDVEAEVEKDERVRRASADVTFDQASSTLSISITCETAAGPFLFVLAADAVTVQLLAVTPQ